MLYILGLVIFFAVHLIPVVGAKPALVRRLGEGGYKGLFAVISLVGFALLIMGWGDFPNVYFYEPPKALKHLNLLLMLPAIFFLTAAYVPNNVRRKVKNPMLTGVKIWALGHLLANGDLRSQLLFGSFLVYAVVDVISVKKRGTWQPKARVKWVWDVACGILALVGYYLIMKYHGHLFGMPVIGG